MPTSGNPDPDCEACQEASGALERPTPCVEHATAPPTLSWLRDSVPMPPEERSAPEPPPRSSARQGPVFLGVTLVRPKPLKITPAANGCHDCSWWAAQRAFASFTACPKHR